MKKYIISILLCIGVVLSGCSFHSFQQRILGGVDDLVEKDQEHQQGFVLSSVETYEAFNLTAGYLNLEKKGLHDIPDLCTLIEKQDYEKVRTLNLSNNNIQIVNADLSCLKKMHTLNLSYNEIQSVQALGDLPSLKKLLLQKNEISSIINFPNLPGLEILNLGYNQLKKVTGLDHLTNLVELQLQHNLIEEIVGMENLEKLEQIKLEFNKLKNLDFLDDLKNLKSISATHNELADSVMEQLDKINQLFLKGPDSNTEGELKISE